MKVPPIRTINPSIALIHEYRSLDAKEGVKGEDSKEAVTNIRSVGLAGNMFRKEYDSEIGNGTHFNRRLINEVNQSTLKPLPTSALEPPELVTTSQEELKLVLITPTQTIHLLPLVYVSVLQLRRFFSNVQWVIVRANLSVTPRLFNGLGHSSWIHELEYKGTEKSVAGHAERGAALDHIRRNPSIISGQGWLYFLDGDNAAPQFTSLDSIRRLNTNVTYWANQELCNGQKRTQTRRPKNYLDFMNNSYVKKKTFQKTLLNKIDTGSILMSLDAWRAVDAISPFNFEPFYNHDGRYFVEFIYRLWQLKYRVEKLDDDTVKLFYNALKCMKNPLPWVAHDESESLTVKDIRALLSDNRCQHLYLDMGTNIGVQPRKLVEPSCYPSSQGVFKSVFGQAVIETKGVCIIGFEPNHNHRQRLEAVQKRLRNQGAVIRIFTGVAIGDADAYNVSFYSDHSYRRHEWGSGIIPAKGRHVSTAGGISVVSLHSILQAVKGYGHIVRTLMKMDVEGSEYQAIAAAVGHGVFCSMSKNGTFLLLEEHPQFYQGRVPSEFLQSVKFISRVVEGCEVHIVGGDDESYLHDVHNKSMPECILQE